MRPMLLGVLLISLIPEMCLAQMTICQNDVCTEELNGVKRTLSKEEVGKLQRGNSRTAIGNVQCRFSTNPPVCEKKLGEIFALFPY